MFLTISHQTNTGDINNSSSLIFNRNQIYISLVSSESRQSLRNQVINENHWSEKIFVLGISKYILLITIIFIRN